MARWRPWRRFFLENNNTSVVKCNTAPPPQSHGEGRRKQMWPGEREKKAVSQPPPKPKFKRANVYVLKRVVFRCVCVLCACGIRVQQKPLLEQSKRAGERGRRAAVFVVCNAGARACARLSLCVCACTQGGWARGCRDHQKGGRPRERAPSRWWWFRRCVCCCSAGCCCFLSIQLSGVAERGAGREGGARKCSVEIQRGAGGAWVPR